MQAIPFNCTSATLGVHLLLSEADSFLDCDCELLIERLVRLVSGQIETIETVQSVSRRPALIDHCKLRTMYATWAADWARQPSQS